MSTAHGFWWHFWNDPIRHNPWSLCALMLLTIGYVLALLLSGRPRRR